jgi:poly-gamma-glutamate capsule biosynthesis protein CapA/YwtB (metallophosphatase superfamily)
MLARGVARRAHPARRANETGSRASVTGQAGWSALLAGVAPVLRRADLAIANLESPLVSAGQCLPGGTVARPRLCGDPRGVAALRAAGVDAVTLANNHALDAGLSGLRHTARRLQKAGIVPLGLEAARRGTPRAERLGPLTVVAVSLTVAAHPPGVRVPLPSPAALAAAIRRARRQAPARPVLVLAHLGREGDPLPGPRERAYGRAAVGAGAAAVVLHGAHVRRALVRDRGVPVHLGLGNLLFYQRAPKHRVGELLGLAFPRPSASATSPGVRVVARRCVDSRRAVLIPCP